MQIHDKHLFMKTFKKRFLYCWRIYFPFMKKMVLLLLPAVCLLGCKKDKADPEAVFAFTTLGTSYEWKGAPAFEGVNRAGAAIGSGTTAFFLAAFDYSNNNYSRIDFSITRDTELALKTYRLEGGGPSGSLSGSLMLGKEKQSDVVYSCQQPGDFIAIAITEIDKGFVSGTFQARLTGNNGQPNDVVDIRSGKFEHVKIMRP